MAGDELRVTLLLTFLALVLYVATWMIEGPPNAYRTEPPPATASEPAGR